MSSESQQGVAALAEDLEIRRGDHRWRVPGLRLERGGACALFGPSGVGKTSLLRAFFGLLPDADLEGRRELFGRPVPPRGSPDWRALLRERVCFLTQDARAALEPVRRVGEQIREHLPTEIGAAELRAALQEGEGAAAEREAQRLLHSHPHQLSGGECRRVQLAIARLRRPQLLVADEPGEGLDADRRQQLVAQLLRLRGECGTALWVATHDRALGEALGARLLRLEGGVLRDDPGDAPSPTAPRDAADAIDGAPLLAARGLGCRYGARQVFADLDLALRPGEMLGLVGPSGVGKSSLLRVLAGRQHPDAGTVERAVADRRAVQLLSQDAYGSLTPHLSIREQVREVAVAGFDTEAARQDLGLDGASLARRPLQLSGGQQRRAALLRALAVEPRVLLLDEPTASLDPERAAAVMAMLHRLRPARGLSILLVTHDLELARRHCDRVLRLEGGRLCTD